MTRRALFRESTTGALDDGAGGVVHGVPDPSGEPDGKVLETSSGALVYGTGGTGGDVAGDTHAATSKTTPVDADEIPLVDSAASFALKKLTWANLKATTKAYFDTLYPSGSGTSTGTNTGDQTTVSGNAGTATALQTSRNIDGQAFNGTADITVIAPGTHAATSKATPVDADELALVDSAASNVLKKLTWANQKATLKAYFDTLYTGAGVVPVGSSSLVYRYTVTGSDKTSIDTGVDTPDAGSNDWTNGDLLEILFYLRTDDAAATATVALVLNNNTGSIYDRVRVTDSNTTVTGANVLASAEYDFTTLGSTAAAGAFGASFLYIPNFAGTVGWKAGMFQDMLINTLAASTRTDANGFQFRDTTAISRLKIAAAAGQKLKVGSQLLIYKRLAS